MARLSHNLAANFMGQGVTALAGVLFLPVYVHLLGIERFALIGIYASLYAVMALLDGGLSTTLNREMAADSSAAQRRARLRAMECVYVAMAGAMGIGVWLLSPLLARHWLGVVAVGGEQVAHIFALMGLVLLFQLPVTLYNGGLLGQQRHIALNAVNAAFAILRWGGAALVLWILPPRLETYFLWHAGASCLHAGVLATMLWRGLGGGAWQGPQLAALRGILRFSGGVWAVSLLGAVLLQADKLILGRLLPLATLGQYMLAAMFALVIARASSPIFSSFFPRLSALVARGNRAELWEVYHFGVQAVAVIVLPIAFTVALFAHEILLIWTRDAALAGEAAVILRLLSLGVGCSGLLVLPYALLFAHGGTRLAFFCNLAAVALLVPGLVIIADGYGAVGAAALWLAVNAALAASFPLLCHHKLAGSLMLGGWLRDLLPPALAALLTAGLLRWAASGAGPGWQAAAIVACAALSIGAAVLAAAHLRGWLLLRLRGGLA